MKCSVCNKNLFIELDFRTLFKMNYTIHESCKKYVEANVKNEVVPIENNTVIFLYFFDYVIEINQDFMESMLIGKGFEYCLNNSGWSIIVWMTQEEFYKLDTIAQYFLLKLCDQSLVFLNMFRNM